MFLKVQIEGFWEQIWRYYLKLSTLAAAAIPPETVPPATAAAVETAEAAAMEVTEDISCRRDSFVDLNINWQNWIGV